jgi:hypothetical protein
MIEKQPKWSFTKGPKFAIFNNGWDKNQTYDTRRLIPILSIIS